jgi:hypothetical protein
VNGLLAAFPKRERRGSRARCILLTDGPREAVAESLARLAEPFATVDAEADRWLPRGFGAPGEARLGESTPLLSADQQRILTGWWLAVAGRANTPNWDLAATCTMDGRRGLILVEAKAHYRELKAAGDGVRRLENVVRIQAAISEANDGLHQCGGQWHLSCDSHYQLANRFAWCWKLVSLGVPVVLVYLGFLQAAEMSDQGSLFDSHEDWEAAVRAHSRGVLPEGVWGNVHSVGGTALVPLIRSMRLDLTQSVSEEASHNGS